jgi:hypothetical protein
MRKPAPTSSRNYFTKETEEWVIRYNNNSDPKEKEKIFQEHLYFPFYKLAENIINSFKFYHMDVDRVEDLKLDVLTMIIQDNKLAGFDPSKGAKAFSYFGTVIKRWLIGYSNANYARKKRQVNIENYENSWSENREIETAPTISLASFFDNWIEDMYEQLPEMFPKKEDQDIANAVLTVFRSRKDLQLFKKKEIYIYVREITGCDTPYLTKVIAVFKDDFLEKYKKLLKEGLIDTEESYS